MELTRRQFMGLTAAALTSPLLARCEMGDALPSTSPEFLLDPACTYLNAGSVGACPRRVLAAHRRAWEQLERDPTHQEYTVLLPLAEEVRAKAARLLGCDTDELAIVHNTTDGMNQIAQGLNLQPGDEVLTTDQEHPGGSLCWSYYQRSRQVKLTPVPLPMPDGDAATIVQRFADAITPATRIISVSHVTYTTGMLLPIRQLADLAHQHNLLLVVDGAQSAGQVPVHLHQLDCDAYATSPHKWLLAPKGSGLLVIRKRVQAQIQPIALQSGYRVYTGATGTRDLPAILALGEALDLFQELGMETIHAHNAALRNLLLQSLPPGISCLSPQDTTTTMVTLGLPPGMAPSAVAKQLHDQHNITVRTITGKAANGLRISLHLYNSPKDVKQLISALADIYITNK